MTAQSDRKTSNKTNSTTSIALSAMPLISPNALLHAHLRQSPPSRPSKRSPTESRPINLNIGSLSNCNGSSLIKIGSTTVVCGIRAEILPVSEIPTYRIAERSYDTSSSNGNTSEEDRADSQTIQLNHLLVPNLELSTGCSPAHLANTAPSIEAQSISQRLLSLLHSSNLVRLSDLSILYTPSLETIEVDIDENSEPQLKGYWVLYIDMMCISYGGSIFDAAWLALYSALRDVLLPKAWWDIDQMQIICSANIKDARRLRLRGMPIPCSFRVFVPEGTRTGKDRSTWILVDTDAFEEGVCHESGSIIIDCGEDGRMKVLRIEKSGGDVIDTQQIKEVMSIAQEKWKNWKKVLENALGTS